MSGVIKNNKLSQLIDEPARVTPTSATLPDLVVTYNPRLVLTKNDVPQVITDHDLIRIKVKISKPKCKPLTRTFHHIEGYSKDILCNLLVSESHTFNQIMETDDVDQRTHILNNIFIQCLDNCAPVATRQIKRPFALWFNDDLREAIKKRMILEAN